MTEAPEELETTTEDVDEEVASSGEQSTDTSPDPSLSDQTKQLWEMRLGRNIAFLLFGILTAGYVIAIFASVFRAVTDKPKVTMAGLGKGKYMESALLKTCVKRLNSLDRDLEEKSTQLWFKMRHGSRYGQYLALWKDFSKNWRHRMDALMLQCPLTGESEISGAFRRATRGLKLLQKKQEKAFLQFFGDSQWLFREVRQGIHTLKEELR